MLDRYLFGLTMFSALGCGLIAGAFFAFSVFVMKALARLPSAQGIAAMQSINIVVINPWFMTAFLGTALTCALLAVSALSKWHQPGAAYLLAGGLLYLIGTLTVTMVFNVPRNDALAAVDPSSADGAGLWAGYVAGWTAWNHVRTIAALAAAASFIVALVKRS
ncbi:MAG TPA: anthrone oxygenase family protein [Blastocatellia bacterium]|nr:anthrone oxygenase family protein [Blastocatellia bacterium]